MPIDRLDVQSMTGVRGEVHLADEEDYTMTIRDAIVFANSTTSAVTVTLPPVAEAKGLFFTIINAAGTNETSIADNNGDSYNGDPTTTLDAAKDAALLYSDGKCWHVLAEQNN